MSAYRRCPLVEVRLYLYVVGTMPKCPPTGSVRLQEVSVSGGSTVLRSRNNLYLRHFSY